MINFHDCFSSRPDGNNDTFKDAQQLAVVNIIQNITYLIRIVAEDDLLISVKKCSRRLMRIRGVSMALNFYYVLQVLLIRPN